MQGLHRQGREIPREARSGLMTVPSGLDVLVIHSDAEAADGPGFPESLKKTLQGID